MTSIMTGEVHRLLAHAPLVDLVGDRVKRQRGEQNDEMPEVVVVRTMEEPDITQEGPSGLVTMVTEIDCWGRDGEDAENVAAAVTDAVLEDFEYEDLVLDAAFQVQVGDVEFNEATMLYGITVKASYWARRIRA